MITDDSNERFSGPRHMMIHAKRVMCADIDFQASKSEKDLKALDDGLGWGKPK
ncbi:MAG TPA: hypothetical protein VHX44_10250 [Planctomycetota bacterium]|nr:hypothetical protein [Planctomycetota bacterium]